MTRQFVLAPLVFALAFAASSTRVLAQGSPDRPPDASSAEPGAPKPPAAEGQNPPAAQPPADQEKDEKKEPATFTAGWRDGFVLQSEKGDFRLQIGVLLHADGRFAAGDETGIVNDTFLIRRLRPYLRGRFAQRFEFFLNPDFGGGTLVLQDAYIDTVFAPAFRLRVGKGKTPFGLERLQSVSSLLFFERAFPTALVPNRDVGIQVLGDISGGLVSYQAGVMNGVSDGASGDVDLGDSKDVAGRLVVRPSVRNTESPLRGLTLAIAGSAGRQSGALALPTFRTTEAMQPFFTYLGSAADGVRTRYSPQLSYFYKAFGGLAEYVHSEMPIRKGTVRSDVGHDAWQIAGSFVLTGEAATDSAAGVRPRANFDFGQGHWGAFQIAARYHALEVDEEALTLELATPGSIRKAAAWTAGLNWYLTPNFKYVFNYERTAFEGDADAERKPEHAFVFRTQIAF